ncbi:MAG: carbohydrate binding family 9 domain-containing protein [Undibacterium sp.]|nr:carbohydrate binding family 9 domain-containing protein [Undibacterium sp.]
MSKFFLLILLLLYVNEAHSQSPAQIQSPLLIPRAKSPPVLHNYLNGAPADSGVEVSDLRQRIPNDGLPVSKSTKVYLSFDDTHFYAIFIAKDDPELIRARIAKRENIFGDDFVILDLDTFHDKRRSFTFFVNPYGVQLDAKRTDGLDIDRDFDTQWESEGQLTSDGYVAKMAIPFKSLRFKSNDVQTWGIAVGRRIERLNEVSFWPHLSTRVAGFVSEMASITIPEKLTAGRNVQINPFVYAGKSRILSTENSNNPFWKAQDKLQGGLDAKWVIGDAMAVDLTLKPDFSEVESDEPQILIDKRYEVLQAEKRPFFLENAGFFTTPIPLFFSRRIIEPNAGLRVTGRENGWSYGGLFIDDESVGKRDSSAPNFGQNAHIAIARVQNDIIKGTNLGMMATNRRFGEEQNTVLSFDIQHELTKNLVLKAQTARSQTVSIDGKKDQGQLHFVEANYQDLGLLYLGRYSDISARFDPTLGYVPRTDIRQLSQEGTYQWFFQKHDWLQTSGIKVNSTVTRDHQNTLQDWSVDTGFILTATRNSWFEIFALNSFEKYAERHFNKRGWSLNVGSNWWDAFGVTLEASSNDAINYIPAKSVAPFLGNGRSANLTLTFKPHPQWRLEEKILWNDLRTKEKSGQLAGGESVYRDLLFRTKLTYQYDRFLGVRLIADYHSLESNPLLSGFKSGKQLNTDIQINYLWSPGTTLYTGYGNRQENLALIGNPSHLQNTENLSLRTGRRIFIKLSYLYQL